MRKTVVHLVPAMEQGGVERVVCDLNRALVRAGWRSVVVSRGGRLVAQIVADGGEHVALDLKSKNPLTCLSRAWRLRRAIRGIAGGEGEESRGGDARGARDASGARGARLLVCAHSRVPAWLFVCARTLDNLIDRFSSLHLSPHLHLHLSPPPPPSLRLVPWITYAHGANSVSRYSAVMTKGDLVVVPSKFLKGFLLENYADAGDGSSAGRTLSDRIRVVHPAVDLERFDPAAVDAEKVAALRREWGVCDGERVEMAVGRISALKGFDGVIRDFAAGGASATAAKRLIVVGGVDKGKEALLADLKRLASELGVADRVVFAGARDDVPACLAVADEVVSGNVVKPESFGLSVAEALAMDKEVRLLRHFGGAGEILDEVAERGGAASRREAIRALCDVGVTARKTLAVYEEALG